MEAQFIYFFTQVVRFVVFNKDLESIKAYKVALQQAQSGQTGIPGPRAGGNSNPVLQSWNHHSLLLTVQIHVSAYRRLFSAESMGSKRGFQFFPLKLLYQCKQHIFTNA